MFCNLLSVLRSKSFLFSVPILCSLCDAQWEQKDLLELESPKKNHEEAMDRTNQKGVGDHLEGGTVFKS